MKKRTRIIFKVIGGLLIAVAVLFILVGIWFYKTPFNNSKVSAARIFPFPVMLIGGKPVWASEVASRFDIAKNYYKNSGRTFDEKTMQRQAITELASEKTVALVAKQYGIRVTNGELDTALQSVVESANAQSPGSFKNILNLYGVTENEFRSKILQPQLLKTNLLIWFNSQRQLNPAAYKQADTIVAQIHQGADFSSLVPQFTQDASTKNLGGDLGLVSYASLLPEFKEAIDGANTGSVVLVPSRYGLHIMQIKDKDMQGAGQTAQVHLFQIFLSTENFQQWLDIQTSKIKVKELIKF